MAIIDEARLKEIEARAEAAQPGEWRVHVEGGMSSLHADIRVGERVLFALRDVYIDDCRFVACARQDVPDLCETIRALVGLMAEAVFHWECDSRSIWEYSEKTPGEVWERCRTLMQQMGVKIEEANN